MSWKELNGVFPRYKKMNRIDKTTTWEREKRICWKRFEPTNDNISNRRHFWHLEGLSIQLCECVTNRFRLKHRCKRRRLSFFLVRMCVRPWTGHRFSKRTSKNAFTFKRSNGKTVVSLFQREIILHLKLFSGVNGQKRFLSILFH